MAYLRDLEIVHKDLKKFLLWSFSIQVFFFRKLLVALTVPCARSIGSRLFLFRRLSNPRVWPLDTPDGDSRHGLVVHITTLLIHPSLIQTSYHMHGATFVSPLSGGWCPERPLPLDYRSTKSSSRQPSAGRVPHPCDKCLQCDWFIFIRPAARRGPWQVLRARRT